MTERVGRVQQVVLLCLLALCVTAMHHVPASEPGAMTACAPTGAAAANAAMDSGGHQAPCPGGEHDLRHLCLAVLTAIGGLLLACVLLLWRPGTGVPARWVAPRGSPAPDRPPDRPGRTVLTSLCVLRV